MQGETIDECFEFLLNGYQLTDPYNWISSLYKSECVKTLSWVIFIMHDTMGVIASGKKGDHVTNGSFIEIGPPIFLDGDHILPIGNDDTGKVIVRPYFVRWREREGFEAAGIVWDDKRNGKLVLVSLTQTLVHQLAEAKATSGKKVDLFLEYEDPRCAVATMVLSCRFPDKMEEIVARITKLSHVAKWRISRNVSFFCGQTRPYLQTWTLKQTVIELYYNEMAKKWKLPTTKVATLLSKQFLLSTGFFGEPADPDIDMAEVFWAADYDMNTPVNLALSMYLRDSWTECVSVIRRDGWFTKSAFKAITKAGINAYPPTHHKLFVDTIANLYAPPNDEVDETDKAISPTIPTGTVDHPSESTTKSFSISAEKVALDIISRLEDIKVVELSAPLKREKIVRMGQFDPAQLPLPPSGEGCVNGFVDYILQYEPAFKSAEECSYNRGRSVLIVDLIRQLVLTTFAKSKGTCMVAERMKLAGEENRRVVTCGDIKRIISDTRASRIVQILYYTDDGVGHANTLIWDRATKKVYLFEPNGSADWEEDVSSTISSFIATSSVLSEFQLVRPIEYCPDVFGQAITKSPNCANWAMMFALMAINCPSTPISELAAKIGEIGSGSRFKAASALRYLMQRFSGWLDDYLIISGLDELWKCSDLIALMKREFGFIADNIPQLGDTDSPARTYIELLAIQRTCLLKIYNENRVIYETCRGDLVRDQICGLTEDIKDRILHPRRLIEFFKGPYVDNMLRAISEWDPDELINIRDSVCATRRREVLDKTE